MPHPSSNILIKSRLLIVVFVFTVLTFTSCQTYGELGEIEGKITANPPQKYNVYKTASGVELISSKYSYSSKVGKIYEQMTEIRAKALANLEMRLGIKYEDNNSILIRLRDIGIKDARGKGILMAQRITENNENGESMVIQLFNEYIMMNMVDTQEELNHEITHAVMRELLGKESYTRLPKWFREGTAVYCASQGKSKMDVIFSSAFNTDMNKFINGLEGKHSFSDYAEDYLAFDYIEKEHSIDKLKEIVRRVVFEKETYQAAVAGSLGMPYSGFLEKAKEHALQQADQWVEKTKGFEDFMKAKQAFSTKNYTVGTTHLNACLLSADNEFIITGAKYYLARCSMLQKDWDKASSEFEYIQKHGAYTNYVDRSFYYPAHYSYPKLMTTPEEATPEMFRKCEQNFINVIYNLPYSGFADDSMYYLGHLYKKFSFYKPSAELFLQYIEFFPTGGYVQTCNLNVAECYLELGEKDNAFKYAKDALKGISPKIREKAKEILEKLQDEK